MNSYTPNSSAKRPGRPPNGPIDRIRVMVWLWAVAIALGKKSGYALELHFTPEKVQRYKGITKRPCKFDKFKRGDHVPKPELVDMIEEQVPGTKVWLEHPLWKVAKTSVTNIDELYKILGNLRPGISELLFPNHNKNGHYEKIQFSEKLLKKLDKEGDIDALTACLGLIYEAKYYNNKLQHWLTARKTFRIFLRVFTLYQLTPVAQDVFEYIRDNFLDSEIDKQWCQSLKALNIESFISFKRDTLLLIEDLYIFKHFTKAPASCLYFTDRYIPISVFQHFYEYYGDDRLEKISRHPQIKKLTRCLRRWESKTLTKEIH
jgi:hypothetical protein